METVSHWDRFCSSLEAYAAEGVAGLRCRSKFHSASGLRLVCVEATGERRWGAGRLRKTWREVHRGNCRLLLLLVTSEAEGRGWLCYGWSGDDRPAGIVGDDLARLTAVCERAFTEERDLVVWERLATAFDALGEVRKEAVLGLRHGELFSRHYMEKRAWKDAERREGCLRDLLGVLKRGSEDERGARGVALLQLLGFEVAEGGGDAREAVLRVDGKDRAFGLVLRSGEGAEYSVSDLSDSKTAAGYAIEKAREGRFPFAFVVGGDVLRLYVRRGFGEGEGGGGDVSGDFSEQRYLEADVLLAMRVWLHGEEERQEREERVGGRDAHEHEAGLRALAMLFSSAALDEGGVLEVLSRESRLFVRGVEERLRTRIYTEAMPLLAEGLAKARGIVRPNRAELDETYTMAMTVLFRLLFVAYAEDKALIPNIEEEDEEAEQQDLLRTQKAYRARSLKGKAEELSWALRREARFDSASEKYWREVDGLFRAIDKGDRHMGLPAYNGGLFRKQGWEEDIALTDAVFAPILQKLLLEDGDEGARGPVDFADLSVRQLGTIYEGLLESELSHTDEDLVVDSKSLYRPKTAKDKASAIKVYASHVYLHDSSGARKSTGSYYTPDFCVEHLLDGALEPALDEHFARLDGMEKISSEVFFDVRVADIAMGSGHFLVAAAERMAQRFTEYYKTHKGKVAAVAEDLERLRKTAKVKLQDVSAPVPKRLSEEKGGEEMLLRRQIVGRCLYGVDRNELAVHLARVSLWIHSFVPGLPLSYLDRNFVCGDALVGVGTMEEIEAKVRAEGALFEATAEEFLGDAKESLRLLSCNLQTSVAEVKEAETAAMRIEELLQPTEAWCNVMTSVRIDPKMPSVHSSNWRMEKKSLFKSKRHRDALEAIEGLRPVHFPVAFPEVFLRERQGFDVIVGNPPWEKVKFDEEQFWTRYINAFNGFRQAEKESLKIQYKKDYPNLVALLKAEREQYERMRKVLHKSTFAEGKKGLGAGDLDLHKVFSWRYWQLIVRQGGRIGVVMPRSVLQSKGLQKFRQTIFCQANSINPTSIINIKNWCFAELDARYAITLLTIDKISGKNDAEIHLRGTYSSREAFDASEIHKIVTIKSSKIMKWGGAFSLPNFPLVEFPNEDSEKSLKVLEQLRLSPSLDCDDGKTWRVRPHSELHATNEKFLMDKKSRERPDGAWPVYKGKSFDLWQHDTGEKNYYLWAQPENVIKHLQEKRQRNSRNKNSPFSEFPTEWIDAPETLPCFGPRLVFRDIMNATTNPRTLICALIPSNIFCTNKAPDLLFPRGDKKDQTYLLGILCSHPLDWLARRFVEINVNYHIFNNLPVPRPAVDDPLRERVIALAGRLACPDSRFQDWAEKIGVECGALRDPEKKEEMIAELDAVAAHLYGLSRAQLSHIFETFHIGWDYKPQLARTLKYYEKWG